MYKGKYNNSPEVLVPCGLLPHRGLRGELVLPIDVIDGFLIKKKKKHFISPKIYIKIDIEKPESLKCRGGFRSVSPWGTWTAAG